MKYTPSKINRWMFLKLPAAWLTGVRLTSINDDICEVKVRHRWISQNPYRSMYWAVQGMAAELTTGILIMQAINESKKNISMLVLNNKANFSKKAKGLIRFNCNQGKKINETINRALETKKSQTVWVKSHGKDESGDVVSSFEFEWTIMLKK